MGKHFSQVCGRTALVLFAVFLLLPGYTAAADKILKIDPRHVVGMQDMPSEITSMLEDLGYERLPIRDPVTGQPVQAALVALRPLLNRMEWFSPLKTTRLKFHQLVAFMIMG
jgi:hypothetical protein